MPELPSPHAIAAIVLALVAVYLYTRDRIPLETSSFLILAAILVWVERYDVVELGERVRAGDILADFGNEALLSVVCLVHLILLAFEPPFEGEPDSGFVIHDQRTRHCTTPLETGNGDRPFVRVPPSLKVRRMRKSAQRNDLWMSSL